MHLYLEKKHNELWTSWGNYHYILYIQNEYNTICSIKFSETEISTLVEALKELAIDHDTDFDSNWRCISLEVSKVKLFYSVVIIFTREIDRINMTIYEYYNNKVINSISIELILPIDNLINEYTNIIEGDNL